MINSLYQCKNKILKSFYLSFIRDSCCLFEKLITSSLKDSLGFLFPRCALFKFRVKQTALARPIFLISSQVLWDSCEFDTITSTKLLVSFSSIVCESVSVLSFLVCLLKLLAFCKNGWTRTTQLSGLSASKQVTCWSSIKLTSSGELSLFSLFTLKAA